jgi:glyoxylase-like metal-dependent hydrolase (beta-lactamase superfamily II)
MQLADGIEVIGDDTWGHVRAFLVVDDDGLTLVDTLGEAHPFMILAAMRRLGRPVSDLKRILLTHAHFSHLAGVAALKALSGAEVYAHAWEADIVAGHREAQRLPLLPRRPFRVYYPFQFGAALGKGASGTGNGRFRGCDVDHHLADEDGVGSRLRAVHAPGHTPGHLAFWVESERVLLAGDAIVRWPRLAGGWQSFTLNERQQRKSLHKLAKLAPDKVGVGHGDPIMKNAAGIVRHLADRA